MVLTVGTYIPERLSNIIKNSKTLWEGRGRPVHLSRGISYIQEKRQIWLRAIKRLRQLSIKLGEASKDLQEAHPELESVEVYQERIALAKQSWPL